jgi:hypothetical protein
MTSWPAAPWMWMSKKAGVIVVFGGLCGFGRFDAGDEAVGVDGDAGMVEDGVGGDEAARGEGWSFMVTGVAAVRRCWRGVGAGVGCRGRRRGGGFWSRPTGAGRSGSLSARASQIWVGVVVLLEDVAQPVGAVGAQPCGFVEVADEGVAVADVLHAAVDPLRSESSRLTLARVFCRGWRRRRGRGVAGGHLVGELEFEADEVHAARAEFEASMASGSRRALEAAPYFAAS